MECGKAGHRSSSPASPPPTLDALRGALSPRAEIQDIFPHVLHFSGHAWKGGLLFEDEFGQTHYAKTDEVVNALKNIPCTPKRVVLNGCETAAEVESVAQGLLENGLARAAVGHTRTVFDPEAVAFAAKLYAELACGYALKEALERAQKAVTTHNVLLLEDENLCFKDRLDRGEPVIDDRRPKGNLPPQSGLFRGRGRDLIEIARHLAHPPQVVVLSGPLGIGKTALALEAAHRNGWRFPGGVAFAEAPREEGRSASASDLLMNLAGVLGVETNPEEADGKLREYTFLQPTVFLLDNLESLPPPELERLGQFLNRLGGESVAPLSLRPSSSTLKDLPIAVPNPLHHGLEEEAAIHYALTLAERRNIPLKYKEACRIVQVVDGHPLLVEKLVAQARRRDLQELLKEIEQRRGEFQAQLSVTYAWCAQRAGEEGRRAWRVLPLFPAGRALEAPLRALAGENGLKALREASLSDFDPRIQAWIWHATASECARIHWPLSRKEEEALLRKCLPAWIDWLEFLSQDDAPYCLEIHLLNLAHLVMMTSQIRGNTAWEFLRALEERLPPPDRTLTLRPLIAEVCRAELNFIPEETEERARLLNNLSVALFALGRREEALQATQQAVRIYRQLAAADPQGSLPDLAMSLNKLGINLSELGRREEALQATQQAVIIYRQLAGANSQAFLPSLAASLNNLGKSFSALDRGKEALDATEEAVVIYRQLARSNPEAFLPNLARSLGIHGEVLVGLGQLTEAAQAFAEGLQQIVPFLRALPQAFAPLVTALRDDYLAACQASRMNPDAKLMEEVKDALPK